MITQWFITLAIVAGAAPVTPPAKVVDPSWIARGQQGMVASDSPEASQAGLEILQEGGNAIDAAVAVSFALAVTRPQSTGLGGGGFMIARFADGTVVAQDFRETAPAAATYARYTKYVSGDTHGWPASRIGALAVAVPGVVAGRCEALSRYGTLTLEMVLQPAIRLAYDGFPVDHAYVEATREALAIYKEYPQLKHDCRYVYDTHLRGGKLRREGEILVQPQLAQLISGVANGGPDFFYRGAIASAMELEMSDRRGLVTNLDLAKYKVRERKAIRTTYRDYEIIGMPPPSSGGVAIAEALNILETLDFGSIARRDPVLGVHDQIEALKHAFADRARWLGDADFAKVPVKRLTSKAYAKRLAASLGPETSSASGKYGSPAPDDAGTSHFCVVDAKGNVVVSTETINTTFGSLVAIDRWGLILNNEMDDFSVEQGKPNAFGLIQSTNNAVAANKRPLSSMSPTIVLKNGRPFLMLGASGGPRIISSVLNVLLGVTDNGLSLEQAITRLRPHHQWRPDVVYFDTDPPASIRKGLEARGHKIADKPNSGVVQAIQRVGDGWVGASDPRKGGRPAGY